MRPMRLSAVIFACVFCITVAQAGVEQFIDDKTILAGEVDLRGADPAALEAFLFETAKATKVMEPGPGAASEKQVKEGLAQVSRFLTEFKQHGGTTLYFVTTADLVKDGAIAVIAPVPDEKAKAMASLLYSGSATGPTSNPDARGQRYPQRAEVVPGLGAVRGTGGAIDYVKTVQPKDRPDLKAALAAAGDAPVKFAFAPDAGSRDELQKQLPATVLDRSTALLWRDLKWASLAAALPPAPSAKLIAQSADADTAKQTAELVTAALALLRQQVPSVTAEQVAAVTPTVQNDQLVLMIEGKQLTALASAMADPLREARLQALRVQSMSNMRQMLMACHMHAADNQGQWPDNLAATEKYLGDSAKVVMTNPLRPETDPAYVYLKPADPRADAASRMVLYESHTDFGRGVSAGFADGHVEYIANRQRFDQLLAKAASAPAE